MSVECLECVREGRRARAPHHIRLPRAHSGVNPPTRAHTPVSDRTYKQPLSSPPLRLFRHLTSTHPPPRTPAAPLDAVTVRLVGKNWTGAASAVAKGTCLGCRDLKSTAEEGYSKTECLLPRPEPPVAMDTAAGVQGCDGTCLSVFWSPPRVVSHQRESTANVDFSCCELRGFAGCAGRKCGITGGSCDVLVRNEGKHDEAKWCCPHHGCGRISSHADLHNKSRSGELPVTSYTIKYTCTSCATKVSWEMCKLTYTLR